MATTTDIGTIIVRTPGTMGGRPRIDGTRITVATIAALIDNGETPESIVQDWYKHLTLGQVYTALAYYYFSQEEIDADSREADRLHDEMAAEARRNGQGTNPTA